MHGVHINEIEQVLSARDVPAALSKKLERQGRHYGHRSAPHLSPRQRQDRRDRVQPASGASLPLRDDASPQPERLTSVVSIARIAVRTNRLDSPTSRLPVRTVFAGVPLRMPTARRDFDMNELSPIRNFDPADEELLLNTIDRWLEKEVRPVVKQYDHEDKWPAEIVEQMRSSDCSARPSARNMAGSACRRTTYARIVMRISSVWMAITGIFNSHLMLALAIEKFGTTAAEADWLPKLASGEIRGGLALTEPDAGTDLQGIRMTARARRRHYVINGTKTWISNGIEGSVLCAAGQDRSQRPAALQRHEPVHRAEEAGLHRRPRSCEKLGYKSIDSAEMIFDDYRVPGRPSDRRRRRPRLQAGDRRARTRAHQRRGARRRHRRRRAGACDALCPDPQDLRQADRGAPGDPAQARRDGDARPGRAAADARCRAGLRPRRALRPRGRHGEIFRFRSRPRKQHRRPAHPRRLWLFQGIRHRAALPRRAADLHRRGHQRDAADHHRQAMDQEESGA